MHLSAPKELGGSGEGTNPEQLSAAGYAACFHSALRLVDRQAKATVGDSAVGAKVDLGRKEDGGFQLAVTLEVSLPTCRDTRRRSWWTKHIRYARSLNAVRGSIDVDLVVVGD